MAIKGNVFALAGERREDFGWGTTTPHSMTINTNLLIGAAGNTNGGR